MDTRFLFFLFLVCWFLSACLLTHCCASSGLACPAAGVPSLLVDSVVYDDQDTDTVPFGTMDEETAFNNQQDKKIRLHALSTRRLGTPATGQASPEEVQQWVSRHALKNKHTKNKKKRKSVSKQTPTNKSDAGCAQCNQQKKTRVRPSGLVKMGWSRPGIFFLAGPIAQGQMGGNRGTGGGPGLPHGITGDHG